MLSNEDSLKRERADDLDAFRLIQLRYIYVMQIRLVSAARLVEANKTCSAFCIQGISRSADKVHKHYYLTFTAESFQLILSF